MQLEPLPETREALGRVGALSGEDLLAGLISQGRLVRALVPSCVGLSVTMVEAGVTFTLVASPADLSLLDAVQYSVGGPCEDSVGTGATILGGDATGLLGEERWALFGRASAAVGVRSTLSLPVHLDGQVVGGVNLYAADPRAFDGEQERVAAVLGAWAPGAVRNADLSFASREIARHAPEQLDAAALVAQATGVVMAARGVDRHTASEVLADAARRSGRPEVDVARTIVSADSRGDC